MHDISQLNIGETKLQNDQRYDALRNLDNQSDSSTEVGDWGAEDDGNPRRARKRSFWKSLKRCRWLLDTILLLIIVGLLVEKRWKHSHGHQYEFTGDITGFAPKCKSTRKLEMPSTDRSQSHNKSPRSSQIRYSCRKTHLTSGTRMCNKPG